MTITIDGQQADLQYTPKQKAFINSRARYPLIMGRRSRCAGGRSA